MSTAIRFSLGRQNGIVYVHHGATLSSIQTFVQNIAQYTLAEIWQVSATQILPVSNIPAKGSDDNTLFLCAHIFFRRTSDGKVYALKILAPNSVMIFDTNQEVLWEIGQQIASFYSQLAGEAFLFEHGALATT